MSYRIRPLSNGKFAIDNGEELLSACPCCGLAFSERAAKSTVEKLDSSEITWQDAKVFAAFKAETNEPTAL